MSRLLVVHHTPSPATRELLEAVLAGTRDPEIAGVDVVVRPALCATVTDMLGAEGYLFGTTANFGYMSGALKHFFDTTFYALEPHTVGLPYALLVSAGQDGTGTLASVERIVTGYRWKRVAPPLLVVGEPAAEHLAAARELGAALAAGIAVGIF